MNNIFASIAALAHGKDIYIVGGWLRDHFLKRRNRDLDVAFNGDPLRLAKAFSKQYKGHFVVLDRDNKIYRVVLDNNPDIDYVDFSRLKGPDILTDLKKRDFTVNAMALPLTPKVDLSRLIDPLNGRGDIKKRIIRVTSDSSFKEDPLRLLRAFRFAIELKFKITPATLRSIQKNASLITRSAAERIREELFKILAQEDTASTIAAMEKAALLDVIFPEIAAMKKSARRFYFHPHGLWQHSIETLTSLEHIYDRLSEFFPKNHEKLQLYLKTPLSYGVTRSSLLKLVALFHDLAKPECAARIEGRMRFLGHEQKGAEKIALLFHRLRLSRKEIKIGKTLVGNHMRPISLGQSQAVTPRAAFRLLKDAGEDYPELLLLSLADCYSYKRLKQKITLNLGHQRCTVNDLMAYYFREKEKPAAPRLVDGHLLMERFHLEAGPIIGELLRIITEAQATGKLSTTPEALGLVEKRLTSLKKRYKIKTNMRA